MKLKKSIPFQNKSKIVFEKNSDLWMCSHLSMTSVDKKRQLFRNSFLQCCKKFLRFFNMLINIPAVEAKSLSPFIFGKNFNIQNPFLGVL